MVFTKQYERTQDFRRKNMDIFLKGPLTVVVNRSKIKSQ